MRIKYMEGSNCLAVLEQSETGEVIVDVICEGDIVEIAYDCGMQSVGKCTVISFDKDGLWFKKPYLDGIYEKLFIAINDITSIKRYDKSEKQEKRESDMVNHPSHYKSDSGLEVIDVIKAFTADLKGYKATDTGNIIKYILRWPHKNGLEDLKKAQWYLNDLITSIEKEQKGEEK